MDEALQRLREQIVAHPDDLPARRVFADHLLERRDPRGLFIQAQCALSDPATASHRRDELAATARKLLSRYYDHWVRPAVVARREDGVFENGFLERWSCASDVFVARGNRVATQTPLRALELQQPGRHHTDHLMRLKGLAALRSLELHAFAAWPFQALAQAKFTRLEELIISAHVAITSNRTHEWSVRLMTETDWFNRLSRLALHVPFLPFELQALARARVWSQLKELSLTCDREPFAYPVAEAPVLEKLEGVLFDDAGSLVQLLARAPQLGSLTLLRPFVSGTEIGATTEPARRIIEALPRSLRALSLSRVRLNPQAVDALLGRELHHLHLLECELTRSAADQLSRHYGGRLVLERARHLRKSTWQRALGWLRGV